MFLHSGAGLHGHEYSSRQLPNNAHIAPRRILLRSSLGQPAVPPPRSITPSSDGESRAREGSTPPANRRFSLNDSAGTPPSRSCVLQRPRPISDYVPRKGLVVRFEEPTVGEDEKHQGQSTVEATSEDETILSVSELSDHSSGTVQGKKRRRTPRQCTNYLLAYPPPQLRTKQRRLLHIRPKLLLQLQQLSAGKRPTPAIDVLPSGPLAGTVIIPRLARRFPRILGMKGELGLHDLIIVKSEDYDADDSDDGDGESIDKRELIAVISPVSQGRDVQQKCSHGDAEIILSDGSVWKATETLNGSYDFTHVDEAGCTTTARWAKRSVPAASDSALASPTGSASDYKFTFSVLDPLSRRHPIMATLTPASLEVLDHYTTVSQSYGRYPPSRHFGSDLGSPGDSKSNAASSTVDGRTTRPVDEATRILITISSVYVSLRLGQGWPTKSQLRPGHNRSASTSERVRSATFPTTAQATLTTEPDQLAATAARPMLCKRQVNDRVKAGSPSPPPTLHQHHPPVLPRRAMSTGAAFMQQRQGKLQSESPSPEMSPAEIDEEGGLVKEPDVAMKKVGLYRRLKDWGHRLASRKSSHS